MPPPEFLTFLRTQLDAEEAAARDAAAGDGDWQNPATGVIEIRGARGAERVLYTTAPAAAFIAEHAPVRILHEVAAIRRILLDHLIINDGLCGRCVVGDWGYRLLGREPHRWPCDTVRLLGLRYSDQPGYQLDWAPAQVSQW